MNDRNLYRVILEYNAALDKKGYVIHKNGHAVEFKNLPTTEQNIIVNLTGIAYANFENEYKNTNN